MQNKAVYNKNVWLIAVSHHTHDIYTAFLHVLLPYMIVKFGLSYSSSGLMVFLLQVPSLLILFIGMYSDRHDLKYMVAFTPAITAVSMSLIPTVPEFYQACLLLIMAGLSSAVYHVPAPVLIRHLSGENIGTGMSIFMFGGELARFVAPLIIYFAIEQWELEGSYKVMFLGLIISLILFHRVRKFPVISGKHNKKSGLGIAWKRNRNIFIYITGFFFFRGFLARALTSFLIIYLTGMGMSMDDAVYRFSIVELAGAAGAFLSGTISDRIGRKNMLLIISIASPLMMFFFLQSAGILAIVLLVGAGILNFSVTPVILALVQDRESEYPDSANGIFMTINFLIASVTALLFGALVDWLSLETTYYLSTVIFLLGIPFIILLPGDGKK